MEGEGRRSWKQHPLLKRLPLLVLAAIGLWLWQGTQAPERTLVWHLEGPGWAGVRVVEVQLLNEEGELLHREQRFFEAGQRASEVTVRRELPAGRYGVRIFARGEGGPLEPPHTEELSLGAEETRVEHTVRGPSGG